MTLVRLAGEFAVLNVYINATLMNKVYRDIKITVFADNHFSITRNIHSLISFLLKLSCSLAPYLLYFF